jgi:hypothetical protein
MNRRLSIAGLLVSRLNVERVSLALVINGNGKSITRAPPNDTIFFLTCASEPSRHITLYQVRQQHGVISHIRTTQVPISPLHPALHPPQLLAPLQATKSPKGLYKVQQMKVEVRLLYWRAYAL